jgi:hypothetical protein
MTSLSVGLRQVGGVPDGSGIIVPSTVFDSAVAYLAKAASDAAGGYLLGAFKGSKRAVGAVTPINRVDGTSLAAGPLGSPTVDAADAAFGGADSIVFTNASSCMEYGNVTPTASFTVGMIFMPNASGNTGYLAQAYSSPNFGAMVEFAADGIHLHGKYGDGATVINFGNRSVLYETSANILIICGNSAAKTGKCYLNSFSPASGGPTTNAWAGLTTGSWSVGGGFSGANQQSNCRLESGFVCNTDLSSAADGPARIQALIAAAAKQYGIALH